MAICTICFIGSADAGICNDRDYQLRRAAPAEKDHRGEPSGQVQLGIRDHQCECGIDRCRHVGVVSVLCVHPAAFDVYIFHRDHNEDPKRIVGGRHVRRSDIY